MKEVKTVTQVRKPVTNYERGLLIVFLILSLGLVICERS